MSSWNSFVMQSSNGPSFICNDSFHNDPALHSDPENINSFKRNLTGGILHLARSELRANFPFPPTSHGVQITKTVTHKTCSLDHRTPVSKDKDKAASACFRDLVLKADKKPEKSNNRFIEDSSQSREVVSSGRVENQLDENGNPLRVEETTTKSDEDTPDLVQSRKVSRFLEDQLPQKSINSADGKGAKYRKEIGGKEVARKGAKALGKSSAQNKPKTLKSKKNENSARATKILEPGSSCELVHQGTSYEVKNLKQDYNSIVKNTEEECSGERDDEQVALLGSSDAADDGCNDEFNDAETELMTDDALLTCASGQQDLEPIEGGFLAEWNQKIPEGRVSSVRSQSRKKRRRGKQRKQPQNSDMDSLSVGNRISTTVTRIIDPVQESCSIVLPAKISPTNSLNSVSFSCHTPSSTREKPSARVPPSRSTVVDRAVNLKDVDFVLGEKISSDLNDKTLNDLSILQNERIGGVKFCDSECQELVKVSPYVRVEADSNNSLRVDGKPRPCLELAQPLKNGLSKESSTEVLPEIQPCATVQSSMSVCALSPSRKQSALVSQVSQQGKVKPQSTVNPFSVLDSVKPLHMVNQSHPPAPTARIKVEPTGDAKPKATQPPRFKPRSTVNPLRFNQSPLTRVRLHPKVDPVSSSTDLTIPTPSNLMAVKTAPVSELNLAFRILRRRQSGTFKELSTSAAKHFDSSHADVRNSVVMTEQCSNSSYGNGCRSDSSPVTETVTQSINDNEVTTTKSRSVTKKHQNCHRKFVGHDPIRESIQPSDPSSSCDAKSWAVEREYGFKNGSSACDRLPNKPTTLTKNSGPRTNFCSSPVASDPATFDLSGAQQYLLTEFLKTMELKKRGGDVIVLKL